MVKKALSILHICCVYPPYRGGMGNVCAKLAQSLRDFGYDISVCTPRYGKSLPVYDRNVYRLSPLIQYGNAAILPGLWKIIGKQDIIHLHYPFLGSDIIILFALLYHRHIRRKSLSFILHYHMDLVGQNWISRIYFRFTHFFCSAFSV